MNVFTVPQNAQVINIVGEVNNKLTPEQLLRNSDKLQSGDQLILSNGSEIILVFADGTQQTLYGQANEKIPDTDTDTIATQANLRSSGAQDEPSDGVLNEIAAIQAQIVAEEGDIDLPATAAGGSNNEGLSFISVDRSGAETLARAGFDTTNFDASASQARLQAEGFISDTSTPALTITNSSANIGQNNTSTITFQFSENVTGFTQADVTISSGTLSNFTRTDGDNWTATFTPDPSIKQAAEISVADNSYTNLLGNPGMGHSIGIPAVDSPTLTDNDVNTINEDTPALGNVLNNDSDTDDELTVASFTVAGDTTVYPNGATASVENGTLTLNKDGGYIFIPAPDWNGALPVITYTTNTGTTDTLTIEITPVQDTASFTGNDSGNVIEEAVLVSEGTLDITDADVGESTIQAQTNTQGSYGNFTINETGNRKLDLPTKQHASIGSISK